MSTKEINPHTICPGSLCVIEQTVFYPSVGVVSAWLRSSDCQDSGLIENSSFINKKGLAAIYIATSPLILAERTGLEPATPGVTGRYSNQLNYHSW